jgi:AraC family transcriptional regulator of adaptative response/methylated-DNA-[protein]-cysteine methyltransferase
MTAPSHVAGDESAGRTRGAMRLPEMQPATYGRDGQGVAIDWHTTETAVGIVLVASTTKGLCFVEVGKTIAAVTTTLREEFPAAAIAVSSSPRLKPLAEAARALARADDLPSDPPLDIRGTAFQWRVWGALTDIPRGETRTYADIARAIGSPSSVRAVARACATNPIALVVPCHRVIGSDGALHGYRWGVEVKKRLLDMETR